jgi:hypothetical protein
VANPGTQAQFIGQVIRGRLDAREIGDIGDTALSYSEVKALATGNPLLMDKAEADAALARLRRGERAHGRNQDALHHAVTRHEQDIAGLTSLIQDIDAAIARRQDTRGEKFAMTVHGQLHARRAEAGQRLKDLLQQEVAELDGLRQRPVRPGHLGGFPVTARVACSLGKTSVTLALDGAPGTSMQLSVRDLSEADPAGLVTRLENRLGRLEEHKDNALADIEGAQREIAHARASIGKPFPQAAQLAAARQRARQIGEQLEQMAAPPQPADQPAPETAPAPSPGGSEQGSRPRHAQAPAPAHRAHEPSGNVPWRQDRAAPADPVAWQAHGLNVSERPQTDAAAEHPGPLEAEDRRLHMRKEPDHEAGE